MKHTGLDVFAPAPIPEWRVTLEDPRSAITTDHLLRMNSGLAFRERYGLDSDVTRMLYHERDMAAFAAAKALAADPGAQWRYASGTTNVLSRIVREQVGGSAQAFYAFAQHRLFQPLGIRSAVLELDASGNHVGSSYTYARARDWARLGLLFLQAGRWGERELLPAGWFAYSREPTASTPAGRFGAHLWLNGAPEYDANNRRWPRLPEDTFAMTGFQGQFVVVVPSAKLLVVRLGASSEGAGNHGIEALVADSLAVLAADERSTTR